jgi:hypothetical protein
MEHSTWLGSAFGSVFIVPTNLPYLVPDHVIRPSNPDPAHALQKTTDHAARPQMIQVHEDDREDEDDDDHTPSPRTAVAVARTQTRHPSQPEVPAARSGADAQKVGWTVGRRKNRDDMWMMEEDGAGAHRHRQKTKAPVRRRRR